MSDFIDSNVLIYSLKLDDPRRTIALQTLERRPTTSVQALNEFASVARRKLRMAPEEVRDASAALQEWLAEIHPLLIVDHNRAHQIAARYRLQWWDALIVATALRTGADTLITEDLQHGQVFEERLTVVNPFRGGSGAR
jgi:predicted nucleic acid-binding protein